MISKNVRHELLTLGSYYGGIRRCISILRERFQAQGVTDNYIQQLYVIELELEKVLRKLQYEADSIQHQIDDANDPKTISAFLSIAKRIHTENSSAWKFRLDHALVIIHHVVEQFADIQGNKFQETVAILNNFAEMTVPMWN